MIPKGFQPSFTAIGIRRFDQIGSKMESAGACSVSTKFKHSNFLNLQARTTDL
jgi:hypothetical protein